MKTTETLRAPEPRKAGLPQPGDLIYPDQFMLGDEVEPVGDSMSGYRRCTVFEIEPEHNLAYLIRPFVYAPDYPEGVRLREGAEEYAVRLDSKSQRWRLISRFPEPVKPRTKIRPRPMYQLLAILVGAIEKSGNTGYISRIKKLVETHFPSGSGTELDLTESTPDKLVFTASYRHDRGWTEHRITVRPDLASGFRISSVSGQNRNDIKVYIRDVFSDVLRKKVV